MNDKDEVSIITTNYNTYTDRQIINAFAETGGNVALSAKKLGCTTMTLYTRLHKNPDLRLALEEARELQIDEADFRLQEAVKRGDAWAIQFTLRTIGRKRGYGEGVLVTTKQEELNLDAQNLLESMSKEDLEKLSEIYDKYQSKDS